MKNLLAKQCQYDNCKRYATAQFMQYDICSKHYKEVDQLRIEFVNSRFGQFVTDNAKKIVEIYNALFKGGKGVR